MEGYHDYHGDIVPLLKKFLVYLNQLIITIDKESTTSIPELQLSQSQIDARIDSIMKIPVSVLRTNSQLNGYNCGIAAIRNKKNVCQKLLEFLKGTSNSGKNKGSSGKKRGRKSTKIVLEDDDSKIESEDSCLLNVSFSQIWDINWTCTNDQLDAYRLFYYALLLKQSEIYIFYEPLDNKNFVLTDQMKSDHQYNQTQLNETTEQYEELMLRYFTNNNHSDTDINDSNANHIIESLLVAWTVTGINFGYIAGSFESYLSHSVFVEGLDSSLLPKFKIFNRLPLNYEEWPSFYSYGMWGAMKIGEKIYFSKCMYKTQGGQLIYCARALSTMCISPVPKMLVLERVMNEMSINDGIIIVL